MAGGGVGASDFDKRVIVIEKSEGVDLDLDFL